MDGVGQRAPTVTRNHRYQSGDEITGGDLKPDKPAGYHRENATVHKMRDAPAANLIFCKLQTSGQRNLT